jgi:aldose 1-epimerase
MGRENGFISEIGSQTAMTIHLIPGAPAASAGERSFTLENAAGMAVTIGERGAQLRAWYAPDRYGRMADVVQAGAEVTPSGGRLARWEGRQTDDVVSLALTSGGDGAGVLVHYRLDDEGGLTIEYQAVAGVPVPLSALAHPFFNLSGSHADVGDHMVQIDADYFEEMGPAGAPAGVAAVGGTAFDFRQAAAIGPRLRWTDTQLHRAGGFDHCFCVRNHFAGGQGQLREVARVFDPASGRRLQLYTTEAAVRFSSGAGLPGMHRLDAFRVEAHARPGLMSAAWPRVMLHPGQVYRQVTVYRLSLQG